MTENASTTMKGLLAASGATPRDVENWIARLPLATHFEPTVRGRARRFSRENVLEIAFITALVRGGVAPSEAVAISYLYIAPDSSMSAKNFLVFRAGDISRMSAVTSLDEFD